MATILTLDTTAAACSVAVARDGVLVTEICEPMMRGHAEALVPMIQNTMAHAQLSFDDLDAIGVTRGPGAFTGLRIGLSAARGLALTKDIPAIGITTFEAMRVRAEGPCVVAIDTKRKDLYVQRFGNANDEPIEAEVGDAGRAIEVAAGDWLITDNVAAFPTETHAHLALTQCGPPRASEFMGLIQARYAALRADPDTVAVAKPEPYYLRAPEARLPSRDR